MQRDAVAVAAQALRLLVQMGKVQHDPLEGIALVGQLQNERLLLHGLRAVFRLGIRLKQEALRDPRQIDRQRVAAVGGDQAKFVVLGGVFQPVGDAAPAVEQSLAACEADAKPALLPERGKDAAEARPVSRIVIGIAVAVPVVVDEDIGRVQRLDLLQAVHRRVEQPHPGVGEDGLEPPPLQVGQRHGGRMLQRRGIVRI